MIAEPIPILSDNYVWCLRSGADAAEALVVDPGDAAPVAAWLHRAGLQLAGVLVTHWHPDHIEGIAALRAEADGPLTVALGADEALRQVLGGGEEHSLVATFAPGDVPAGWQVLGACAAGEPAVLVDGAVPVVTGWDHFRG